jgi:hypothetical protein
MMAGCRASGEDIAMALKCVGSFVIGLFAGVCAVFVPRMGGLLVADDLDRISLFPAPFVVMGVAYAAIVGAILTILYYGRKGTPGERFMAALGIPALLAGALATSAQTGKVQQLQVTAERLSNAAVAAERIRKNDTPSALVPLAPTSASPAAPGASLEILLGIGSAYAQATPASVQPRQQQSLLRFTPVEAAEASYAVLVERTATAEAAQRKVQELRPKYPNAQAVRSDTGFGVVVDVKPESAAVLEAIRVKRELGASPELLRVK